MQYGPFLLLAAGVELLADGVRRQKGLDLRTSGLVKWVHLAWII